MDGASRRGSHRYIDIYRYKLEFKFLSSNLSAQYRRRMAAHVIHIDLLGASSTASEELHTSCVLSLKPESTLVPLCHKAARTMPRNRESTY